MTEFTPGPWEVSTHSGGDSHEIDIQKPKGGGWFLRLSSGYPFAEFPDPEDTRLEFQANVHLIAVAPDLLAALEGVLRDLEAGLVIPDDETLEQARAVIAKAHDR